MMSKETNARRAGMIVVIVLLAVAAFLLYDMITADQAEAAVDVGDGVCQEDDGEFGLWNGSTADDAGCVTFAEYTVQVGPEVLDDQLVVGPDPEPAAPTVREYWEAALDVRFGGPR